jgi:hypothetical protein
MNINYKEFREVLLKNEIEAISKLKKIVSDILFEIRDEDEMMKKISPIFGDMLNQNIEKNREDFLNLFSSTISESLKKSIDSSYEEIAKKVEANKLESISKLEKDIEQIFFETRDKDEIIKKISPIFINVLTKNIETNKEEFFNVLSPIVSESLKDSIQKSNQEIAKIMSPIMGKAIQEQVKTQKDVIIDALYPVIGNMISKYVVETFKDMLDEINAKVQSSFSFENIKRKVVSKIRNVSETELIMREVKTYKVETVFLIHKETGLLISEASNKEIEEADMVASMLSAIRSFVNDWISKNNENFELNSIEYGDLNIYLEVSGCCYIASVVKGEANQTLNAIIRTSLSNIVEHYGDEISNFDGDRDKLSISSINVELSNILNSTIPENFSLQKIKKIGFFPKYLFGVAFSFLISWFMVANYQAYLNNKLKNEIYNSLYSSKNLIVSNVNLVVKDTEVIIEGKVINELQKNIANSIIQSHLSKRTLKNSIVVVDIPPTKDEIKSKIEMIINNIKLSGIDIEYELNDDTLNLYLHLIDSKKQKIITDMFLINGIKNVIFNIKEIEEKLYFNHNEYTLSTLNKNKLKNIVKKYNLKEVINSSNRVLIVEAFTDTIGRLEPNIRISKQRAKNSKEFLVKLGIKSSNLIIKGTPREPKVDVENPRCVIFSWEK